MTTPFLDAISFNLCYGQELPAICPVVLLYVQALVPQLVCDADNRNVLVPTVEPSVTSVLLLKPLGVPLDRAPLL